DEHFLPLRPKRLYVILEESPLGRQSRTFPGLQTPYLIAPTIRQREQKIVHVGLIHPLGDRFHNLRIAVAAQPPDAAAISCVNPPPTAHITTNTLRKRIHRQFGAGQQFPQFHRVFQRLVTVFVLLLPKRSPALLERRAQVGGGGAFLERLAEPMQSEFLEN